ncbi:hypothetical protein MCEMSEM47_01368 [Burkholderiales bacterium]
MSRSLWVLLLFTFLAFPALAIHGASRGNEARLQLGVCAVGSACRSCVERHELRVVREGQQVLVKGQQSGGEPLLERLRDCQFQGNGDWSCSTGLHTVQSVAGRVRFLAGGPRRQGGYEWCDLGE